MLLVLPQRLHFQNDAYLRLDLRKTDIVLLNTISRYPTLSRSMNIMRI
jgi:hypothetical protein